MGTNVGGLEHAQHTQYWDVMDGDIPCSCGVTFHAEREPTCDICGEPQDAGDGWEDWNGETGCHETCEAQLAKGEDPAEYAAVGR